MSSKSVHGRRVGRRLLSGLLGLVVATGTMLLPGAATADLGDCGQPASTGTVPTATDALVILRVAVGTQACDLSTCDVDGSCAITAGDALRVLRRAIGDVTIELSCSCGVTTSTSSPITTTSSTTSTTLPEIPFWPADPADYVTGPLSYFDTLAIPPLAGMPAAPTCCKDYGERSKDFIVGGTNLIDNGLARIAPLLVAAGINFQEQLDASLQDGSLVVLVDHQFLDVGGASVVPRGLPDDEFALVQLEAAFAPGTTFAEASLGDGEFVILRDTFLPGTGEPVAFSFPSMIDTGLMSAGPFELDLNLNFGFFTLDLVATEAELSAVPGPITPAGIPYSAGMLSGIVLIDDIFTSFNNVLNSPDCECLGLTEDIFQKQPDGTWMPNCVADGAALCPLEDEIVCATLAGINNAAENTEICALITPVLQNVVADIDLNADPSRYEGMSIGIEWTAVNAASAGVEPAP